MNKRVKIIRELKVLFKVFLEKKSIIKNLLNTNLQNVDRTLEEYIGCEILKKFPTSSIIGEETGISINKNSELIFIIDRIDGTKCFYNGHKDFSISITCAINDDIVAAFLFIPLLDVENFFWWFEGEEMWFNSSRCKILPTIPKISSVNLVIPPFQEWAIKTHHAIIKNSQISQLGSIAYRIALVCAGKYDAGVNILSENVMVWDIITGIAFLKKVDGIIINENQESVQYKNGKLFPEKSKFYLFGQKDIVNQVYIKYEPYLQSDFFESLLFKTHNLE